MRLCLHVVEERHESKIHVQLLMAVKECRSRIVGDEVDLGFPIPRKHDDILENSCRADLVHAPISDPAVDCAGEKRAIKIAIAGLEQTGSGSAVIARKSVQTRVHSRGR